MLLTEVILKVTVPKTLGKSLKTVQFLVTLLKVNSSNLNKIVSYPCLYFLKLGKVYSKKDLSVATSEINIIPAGTHLFSHGFF